jgi:hypothetical protein
VLAHVKLSLTFLGLLFFLKRFCSVPISYEDDQSTTITGYKKSGRRQRIRGRIVKEGEEHGRERRGSGGEFSFHFFDNKRSGCLSTYSTAHGPQTHTRTPATAQGLITREPEAKQPD